MSFNVSHIANDKLNVQLNYKNIKEDFHQGRGVTANTVLLQTSVTKSSIIEDVIVRVEKSSAGAIRPVGIIIEKLDKDGIAIPLRTMALELTGTTNTYFTNEFLLTRLIRYNQNGFLENEYFTGFETSENDMYGKGMIMMKLKNPIICPFGFKFSLVNRDASPRTIGYSFNWSEVD